MRKLVPCALVPILSLIIAAPVAGQTFSVVPSLVPGISITGPGSVEYGRAIESQSQLSTAASRELLSSVLPYSVLVSNLSTRTITYYVVRYDYRNSSGVQVNATVRTDRRGSGPTFSPRSNQFAFPIAGLADAVYGGSVSLSSPNAINAQSRILRSSSQSPEVVASLDAVVFDDGEFVGPDKSNGFTLLNSVASQMQALLEELRVLNQVSRDLVLTRMDEVLGRPAVVGGVLILRPNAAPTAVPPSGEQSFRNSISALNLYSTTQMVVNGLRRALAEGGSAAFEAKIRSYQSHPLFTTVWKR